MSRDEMRRLRSILKPLDAHIDWAVDVDSAATLLETTDRFDAVLVDEALPNGQWKEVMKRAGSLGIQTPFLVCTNEVGDDEILTQSKTTLVSDILIRPYVDELVLQRVQHALDTDQTQPYPGATIPSHQ